MWVCDEVSIGEAAFSRQVPRSNSPGVIFSRLTFINFTSDTFQPTQVFRMALQVTSCPAITSRQMADLGARTRRGYPAMAGGSRSGRGRLDEAVDQPFPFRFSARFLLEAVARRRNRAGLLLGARLLATPTAFSAMPP